MLRVYQVPEGSGVVAGISADNWAKKVPIEASEIVIITSGNVIQLLYRAGNWTLFGGAVDDAYEIIDGERLYYTLYASFVNGFVVVVRMDDHGDTSGIAQSGDGGVSAQAAGGD